MHRDDAILPGRRRTPRAADDLPVSSGQSGDTRLGELDTLIGFHLRLAQDASFRTFARHVGDRGLKPGRFAAMTVIQNNPGITQSELSRAIARDKSSITPLIQELEKNRLVRRQPSKTDRRSVSLTLTRHGEMILRRLLVHAAEHDRKLDEIVGPEKAKFITLLKRIVDGLT